MENQWKVFQPHECKDQDKHPSQIHGGLMAHLLFCALRERGIYEKKSSQDYKTFELEKYPKKFYHMDEENVCASDSFITQFFFFNYS